MAETILVMGATGTVGSAVVKQLAQAADDARVRVATHRRKSGEEAKEHNFEEVELDFARPETVAAALEGVDKLFLLTPVMLDAASVVASIAEAAKRAGVKRIVRLSAIGADPRGQLTLGRWHGEAEEVIKSSGVPYVMLRPTSFMQNFVNFFAPAIKAQNAFYAPAGDGRVSLVDARDVAAVAVAALTQDRHEGQAYELTGPEALSYHDVAERLSRATGKQINYVNVSEDDARKGMAAMGIPAWFIEPFLELYALQRAGYAAGISPAVAEVTGREPITFAQFAADYADAFK